MDQIENVVPHLSMKEAVSKFIRLIEGSRSVNTALSYTKSLNLFCLVIEKHGLSPNTLPACQITEDFLPWYLDALKDYSPATEQLYASTVNRFYSFLLAENYSEINPSRVQQIIRMRSRRPGQRLPQFPKDQIEKIIDFSMQLPTSPSSQEDRLRVLRDRAFIISLADTGLRVHEICNLRRGDIDWDEGRAIIIGKGDKQAVVRFSSRAMAAIKDYLSARSPLDGNSGRPLTSLPLFARHDKGAGKKIKTITPTTGRIIVEEKVIQVLGEDSKGKITPHSFRHYFVTTVLRSSGNLKLAQELARHASISVTQRYAHISDDELDRGYFDIFEK